MNFKEIEVKYDASDVKMSKFLDLMNQFKHDKKLVVSSYDYYFTDKNDNFIRYRDGDKLSELTIKRKTTTLNNNERIEVNLPTGKDALKTVTAFVDLLGYKPNFSIYKTCKIFWFNNLVVVYYILYDEEMKETRRFIEIEADEDKEWASEAAAWAAVTKFEQEYMPALGISSKNRLKKSLFEMFRKN